MKEKFHKPSALRCCLVSLVLEAVKQTPTPSPGQPRGLTAGGKEHHRILEWSGLEWDLADPLAWQLQGGMIWEAQLCPHLREVPSPEAKELFPSLWSWG